MNQYPKKKKIKHNNSNFKQKIQVSKTKIYSKQNFILS